MHIKSLITTIPNLILVEPDPKRDAPFAVAWFENDVDNVILRQMGNPESKITPTSLEKERQRLSEFIVLAEQEKQFTWMLRLGEMTIGAVWVEFKDSEYLPSPAISIMIGDTSMQGKGVGSAALKSVLDYLIAQTAYVDVYARYLTSNVRSAALLHKVGFKKLHDPYMDEDGLIFQNAHLDLKAKS